MTTTYQLLSYDDASFLRYATPEEVKESMAAGPEGVITVEIDGEDVRCYVQ